MATTTDSSSYVLAMTTVMIVLTVVSFTFMSLRFYSKYLTGARFWLDDVCLVTSWITHLVFVILSIICTRYGLGSHIATINLATLPTLLYLLPIAQFFAVISVAISKSSFILTMFKLAPKMWQKIVLGYLLATVNGSLLSISIVQFFQCSVPPTPGCVAGDTVIALGVFAAAYSAATDLFLVGFPIIIIWNLQVRTKEKVGIMVSMSLGVIAGVVGIYKSSTIPKVGRSTDFTYGTALVLIWLVAEVCATIIASSIPFYRPLLRHAGGRSANKSLQDSYVLKSRRRDGHSKIASQTNIKTGSAFDDNSDKGILVTQSRVVEYEPYASESRGATGHRDVF
ncbi:hypothetical protein F5Y16DRAFT_378631 [Xylariaceae sp. FL0255]|nr:hypothetical protein F5Y16DRAFT_378631 [Xylariaceae sp. FL0255]